MFAKMLEKRHLDNYNKSHAQLFSYNLQKTLKKFQVKLLKHSLEKAKLTTLLLESHRSQVSTIHYNSYTYDRLYLALME